ncbi:hypothetical protein ECEC1735_2948, partial [Escherichia coli EC1735]
MLESLR